MKKQIIAVIRTHPVRAAFLLILLFVVAQAMPLAFGQRDADKRSVAPPAVAGPQFAQPSTSAIDGTYVAPGPPAPIPNFPSVVLYDQYNNQATSALGCTPGPWTVAAPVAIDHYGGFMDSNGTVAWEGGGYSFSAGATINQFGRFDPVANTWTPLAPVPDLTNAQASGVYAPNVNKLFVFGGDDPTTGIVVNTTRIYDIATNTWSTGAPMPDVHAFMGSGYYNGKIYLVGGYTTGNVDPSFGQVWEYDPVLNTWNTSRMSMPATLGGPGFGIINGHIYIAGGRNLANTNLNTLYDYDITANTWTARANLPTGVNVPGSAVIGGTLWILGGGNPFLGSAASPKSSKNGVLTPDTSNILQIYDPITNTWGSGPTLNQQRSFAAGTDVGNTAVAAGGYTGSSTTTSVEINVATGCPTPTCTPAWRNEPSIANARRNPATVAVGSNLYAITGFNAAPDYTAVNERFNGTSWTTLAPIPVPHAQSKGAAVGTNIYVPGGFNSVSFGGPLDTMQIYNTTANTWSAGLTMPGTRGGPATTAFNGLVYVIAGYTTPFPTVTNTVFIYNPGTNSYTTGLPMPAGQGNVAGVLFNGEIYVVGGGTAPGAQYAYNPTSNAWRTIAVLPTTGGTCQSGNGFVQDGELWVVGCLGLPINQQVWIYNPGTDAWRAGPPYSVDHQGPGAALFNGRGFAVGGGTAGGGSTAVESYRGCPNCSFRVLIAYSDIGGPPTTLQSQILAEPGVTAVDLFDANSGTPTLGQLGQYKIVVAFSNNAYFDAVAMGNVLADYADTGGVVVGLNFNWFGAPFGLDGRWMTGGYTPFNTGPTNFVTSCLGTYNTTHPLMQGIPAGSLCAFFRHTLPLSPGTVSVASYADGQQLCAYKTNSGHTGVGINAYLGENPMNFSGPFGRVIVNAGRWLGGSCAPVASSVVSRKNHGAPGNFDINLPLSGSPGIECRNGGGSYQIVYTFDNPVTVSGSTTPPPSAATLTGVGSVASIIVASNVVTVNLTGVTDVQQILLTLLNVSDGAGSGDEPVPIKMLIGDSAGTGNSTVNAGDVGFVKSKSGQATDGTNFRADIAINGTINAGDVGLVKSKSGNSLPP